MLLQINDQIYEVPGEEELLLLRQFKDLGLSEYSKIPQHFRVLAKPVAREILKHWEIEASKKFGKEQSLIFRPEKKSDPVEHLAGILTVMLQEFMKNVTLRVSTTEHFATHFDISIKSEVESGGQMAPDGDIRVGQDHSTEVP